MAQLPNYSEQRDPMEDLLFGILPNKPIQKGATIPFPMNLQPTYTPNAPVPQGPQIQFVSQREGPPPTITPNAPLPQGPQIPFQTTPQQDRFTSPSNIQARQEPYKYGNLPQPEDLLAAPKTSSQALNKLLEALGINALGGVQSATNAALIGQDPVQAAYGERVPGSAVAEKMGLPVSGRETSGNLEDVLAWKGGRRTSGEVVGDLIDWLHPVNLLPMPGVELVARGVGTLAKAAGKAAAPAVEKAGESLKGTVKRALLEERGTFGGTGRRFSGDEITRRIERNQIAIRLQENIDSRIRDIGTSSVREQAEAAARATYSYAESLVSEGFDPEVVRSVVEDSLNNYLPTSIQVARERYSTRIIQSAMSDILQFIEGRVGPLSSVNYSDSYVQQQVREGLDAAVRTLFGIDQYEYHELQQAAEALRDTTLRQFMGTKSKYGLARQSYEAAAAKETYTPPKGSLKFDLSAQEWKGIKKDLESVGIKLGKNPAQTFNDILDLVGEGRSPDVEEFLKSQATSPVLKEMFGPGIHISPLHRFKGYDEIRDAMTEMGSYNASIIIDGTPTLKIAFTISDDKKDMYVNSLFGYVRGLEPTLGPNSPGFQKLRLAGIKELVRRMKAVFPTLETISMLRVGGKAIKTQEHRHVTIPINRLLVGFPFFLIPQEEDPGD